MKVNETIKVCLVMIAISVTSCMGTIYFMQHNKPAPAYAAYMSDGEAAILAELRAINKTLSDMRKTQMKIWEPRNSVRNSVFEKIMAETVKAINSGDRNPSLKKVTANDY